MDTSKSGAPIYRYDKPSRSQFDAASGEPSIEEISNHIETHVGKVHMVFHEIISELVHIDVHWVKPSEKYPFHTLVTSGMSDKAMNTPEDVENCDYAELSICLPRDWKVSEEDFKKDENYWPISCLKYLARFPHEYNTWLSYGHTIPHANPAEPFADNTELNTMVLLPSVVFGEEFQTLKLKNKTIDFYTIVPLYTEEVNLKMKKGVEALFDGFDKHSVNDILNIQRPNTAIRKKIFGLF